MKNEPRATALGPGMFAGIPMQTYLGLPAIGSTHLDWIARSPSYYHYMLSQPAVETEAMILGAAVHAAVLEPDRYAATYACEPDPWLIAPDAGKPRSTKAYRDAVLALRALGRIVLTSEQMAAAEGIARTVREHPHAARILARGMQSEVTVLWERDGRLCRARADILGPSILADLKTTRDLSSFNPWTITRLGYHRQVGWYKSGLSRQGQNVEHVFLVAAENLPPYDVGVFALDPELVQIGEQECDRLLARLEECEASGQWPGMYPDVQRGMLTDAALTALAETEAA